MKTNFSLLLYLSLAVLLSTALSAQPATKPTRQPTATTTSKIEMSKIDLTQNRRIRIDPKVKMPQQVIIPGRTIPNGTRVNPGGTSSPTRTNPGGSQNPGNDQAEPEDPDAYLETERLGPDNIRTYLLTQNIRTDVNSVKKHVFSYDGTVYGDQNPKSGYYYYVPDAYHLGWSVATGEYDFDVTYGAVTDEGPGPVTVTATLWPKLRDSEVGMLRDLLRENIQTKPNEKRFGIQEFMPYTMTQRLGIEFDNLTQFGVTDADISLQAPASLDEPIKLTFTTRQIDALQTMFFNNIGLYGNIIINPNEGEKLVPFTLKVDAPATFGQLQLEGSGWRREWRNPTDYPLVLSYLHALRKERNGTYRIYSWSAGDVEVPPGAKVDFADAKVPAWLDKDARVKRVWLDYAIKECAECDAVVKERIFGGGPHEDVAKPEQLEFVILTPLAFTEASQMRIRVRSTQASASSNSMTELESVKVKTDNDFLNGGTLYVRGGDVRFEYKMLIYLEDGTTFSSDWIPSNSKEVVIGSRQIQDHIPEFDN